MEDFKDIVFIVTVIVSVVASFFAVKYRSENNTSKIEEDGKSFKEFKTYIYKELEENDTVVKKIHSELADMLSKREAEERYVTRKELELTIENIGLKFTMIIDKLEDLKKR